MRRVLLVEDLPQVADHLKTLLGNDPEIQVMGIHAQADPAIAQATSDKPEVVLVDALLQGKTSGFDVAKRIRSASPGTRIVVVTVPQKPVTARPEQGIDAVFVLPGGAQELTVAIGAEKKSHGPGQGTTVAVYSPKGGSGRTVIAVNLACVLRRQGSTVAVLDGVMQFGAVRHLVQVPPEASSFIDVPAGPAMKTSLPEALWEGPGGVHFLFAPPRPEQADLVNAPDLSQAAGLLSETHQYVIVDVPSRLSDDTLALLDAAKVILLVTTYGGPAVANARAAIETFDMLGYRKQKPILVVINQADETAGLSRGALEHALGVPIAAEIPTDRKLVESSVAKQEPFVLSSPTAAISQAVAALATALVAQQRK